MIVESAPKLHESTFHQAKRELIEKHARWLATHDPDDLYRNPIHKVRVQRILELTQSVNGQVLDVGCFHGYIAERVMQQGGKHMVGMDRLDAALALARRKGIRTVTADIDDAAIPFPAETFDGIVAGEVLDAVFDPDAVVAELHRVLKPGGTLIITVPNLACIGNRLLLLLGHSPHYVEVRTRQGVGHFRLFTFQTLRTLLTDHGFVIERMQSSLCVSPLIRLSFDRIPLLRRLLPLKPEWEQPRIHFSTTLARLFPQWGEHIIVSARKPGRQEPRATDPTPAR